MRSLDDVREAPPAAQPLYQLDEDGRVPGNVLLLQVGFIYESPKLILKFWPYQLPTILLYFVLVDVFFLVYSSYFTNVALWKTATNNSIYEMV